MHRLAPIINIATSTTCICLPEGHPASKGERDGEQGKGEAHIGARRRGRLGQRDLPHEGHVEAHREECARRSPRKGHHVGGCPGDERLRGARSALAGACGGSKGRQGARLGPHPSRARAQGRDPQAPLGGVSGGGEGGRIRCHQLFDLREALCRICEGTAASPAGSSTSLASPAKSTGPGRR